MESAASSFLSRIERVSAPEREQLIASTAHALTGAPQLETLLGELSSRGRYEVQIAIRMATIAHDTEYLRTMLDSPDQDVLARSLTAWIHLGLRPQEVVDRVFRMSRHTRTSVYRAVRRGSRIGLAERLFPVVREHFGDAEAARILPACSSKLVAAQLPSLAYVVSNWTCLSRRHPTVFLDFMEAEGAAAAETQWPALWSRMAPGLCGTGTRFPDQVLSLTKKAVAFTPVDALRPISAALARFDADRVAEIFLDPSGNGHGLGGRALWRALTHLPDDRFAAVCLADSAHHGAQRLRAVAPERRAAIFEKMAPKTQNPSLSDVEAVSVLPEGQRVELIRSWLGRKDIEGNPAVRSALEAQLPWSEAEPLLLAATAAEAEDERARAYTVYLAAAAATRDPAVVGHVLTTLTRLHSEPYSVRQAASGALARIHPRMFAPPVLPLLLQMMSDATLARDVSEDSLRNFADLTRELLAWGVHTESLDHTEAALRGAALLTPRAVRLDFSDLGRTLPADAEGALFEVLSTQFADEARRGSFGTALDLADGLGKRTWPIGRLQRLIFSACGSTDERTARHAIELAMSNPSTRDDIGHALLDKDPSTIVIRQCGDGSATTAPTCSTECSPETAPAVSSTPMRVTSRCSIRGSAGGRPASKTSTPPPSSNTRPTRRFRCRTVSRQPCTSPICHGHINTRQL